MIRILRPNGRALIYVWAKNQAVKNKSSYLLQNKRNKNENDEHDDSNTSNNQTEKESTLADNTNPKCNSTLPIHTNRTQFAHTDILVPWKLKNASKGMGKDQHPTTFLRFYHVFDENELEGLCNRFENISVEKSYYDQGNWCVIFRKNSAT